MVACNKVSPDADPLSGPAALLFDAPLAIHELNARRSRTGTCSLVSIGDSIEPMGYALAFPFRAASTDVFSRAVTAALYGGTMTAYRARYRIRSQVYLAYMSCLYVTMTAYRARYRMCPQDNACTEEAPEGGDKMDIRSMSGLFVSVAVSYTHLTLPTILRV